MINSERGTGTTPQFDRHRLPVNVIQLGCAGWGLPSTVETWFPKEGSHLERYSMVFPAVEINTSFYRPHRPETYARWRDTVPEAFRFAVKIPRTITHEHRLHDFSEPLTRFLGEVGRLERKLGCLLVQLPPSLRFDEVTAARFFTELVDHVDVPVVCEARHRSWFAEAAHDMMRKLAVDQVIADPPANSGMPLLPPQRTAYVRLHGSPEMYHSAYSESDLHHVAKDLLDYQANGKQVWCIFDNTASGHAVPNALSLLELVTGSDGRAGSAIIS